MKSGVTAIVQTFYRERRKYLPQIVGSLKEQTMRPEGLIIWDNSNSLEFETDLWTRVVGSSRNTLLGRYGAAFLAETEFVYIQDDDLVAAPGTIERLLRVVDDGRCRGIAGISGCVLNREDQDHSYTKARWVREGQADVILGRAFLCHRSALLPGFRLIMEGGQKPGRSDDILFSMAAGGGIVVPCEITNLDEKKTGLSWEPQHFPERDAFANMMLSLTSI